MWKFPFYVPFVRFKLLNKLNTIFIYFVTHFIYQMIEINFKGGWYIRILSKSRVITMQKEREELKGSQGEGERKKRTRR